MKNILLAVVIVFLAQCSGPGAELKEEANLFYPPPPQRPRIQYIRTIASPEDIGITRSWFKKTMHTIFGSGSENEDRFIRPYCVFFHNGRLYVTDPGFASVHVMDIEGKRYLRFYHIKKDIDLISPIGVVADNSGRIYVSDSVLDKVFVFGRDGRFDFSFGYDFKRPTGIAIDEGRGVIYVVDTLADKVDVFNLKGEFQFSFGKKGEGDGEFNYPTHIFFKEGRIYVTDTMNFRIQVFDGKGRFLYKFGRPGDGSGDFSKPKGVASDKEGHIYVVDSDFDNVQIFTPEGKLLLYFGSEGKGRAGFSVPAGIFIDADDRIYVADSYNSRIQVYRYLREKE